MRSATKEEFVLFQELPTMTLDIFEIYHLPVGWYYENHYYHSFDPCHDFITHWMPLPEPPEVSE